MIEYNGYYTNITDKNYLAKCKEFLSCGCTSTVITNNVNDSFLKHRQNGFYVEYVKYINPEYLFLSKAAFEKYKAKGNISFEDGYDLIQILNES